MLAYDKGRGFGGGAGQEGREEEANEGGDGEDDREGVAEDGRGKGELTAQYASVDREDGEAKGDLGRWLDGQIQLLQQQLVDESSW